MDPTTLTALIAAVGTLLGGGGGVVALALQRVTERREAAERRRLRVEVLGTAAEVGAARAAEAATTSPEEETARQEETQSGGQEPLHATSVALRDGVYDQLLINDYALGLTQARTAFNVSMAFSVLGGLVLVLGIALAIFRADTGGQVAGAVITSAAGVLTSGLSQLFRGQSTKALKHLESQAVELRKDVRTQTNAATAERLLGEIADPQLRSRLQAALILEFTGATLPDLDQPSRHPSASPNGHAHTSADTGTGPNTAPSNGSAEQA